MAIQNIDSQTEHASRTVRLTGEIDLANAAELGSDLLEVVAPGAEILVDCSEVTFIDSRGVATFVQVHDTAQRCGATVRWTGIQPPVRRVFDITNLDELLLIEDSTEGA